MSGRRWFGLAAWMLLASCGASTSGGGGAVPGGSGEDAGDAGEVADVPPEPPATPVPAGSAPLVERAMRNLQQRMSLADTSEIDIVSVEPVEWSDAGLDCPDPEMNYAQVVTPGFIIVLGVADRTFEYHSDDHYSIILCTEGRPTRGGH